MSLNPRKPITHNAPELELKVSDIKQWFYCKRVVYFSYCQPVAKRPTYKMLGGKEVHAKVAEVEKRRTLGRYRVDHGRKLYHWEAFSMALGVRGKLDMVIETPTEAIPVEFKNTLRKRRVSANHKYQLAAYACLLEDSFGKPVRKSYVYYAPGDEAVMVRISARIKQEVIAAVQVIRRMIASGDFPDPPSNHTKCVDCEYLRYCGDRY